MSRNPIRTQAQHLSLALILAVLLTTLGLAKPVAAQDDAPVYFSATQILSYEQLRGQPQWTQNSARRFMSATWQFNADGTFYFAPTYDVRSDLYPLGGRYQVQGNQVTFSASRSAQMGYTSLSTATIDGVIDFSQRTPVVTMTWVNTSDSAAVVNGIGFSGGSSSGYHIQATLAQVGVR